MNVMSSEIMYYLAWLGFSDLENLDAVIRHFNLTDEEVDQLEDEIIMETDGNIRSAIYKLAYGEE